MSSLAVADTSQRDLASYVFFKENPKTVLIKLDKNRSIVSCHVGITSGGKSIFVYGDSDGNIFMKALGVKESGSLQPKNVKFFDGPVSALRVLKNKKATYIAAIGKPYLPPPVDAHQQQPPSQRESLCLFQYNTTSNEFQPLKRVELPVDQGEAEVKNLEVSDDDSYFAVGYSIKVKNAPNYANVAIFCTEANDIEKLALHSVINLTSEPTNLGFGRGGVRTLFISTKDDLFQCAIYQSSFKKTLLDSRGCRLNMGGVNVNGCFYMYSDGGIYRYKSTTERQDSDSIKLVNKVVYANPRIFMCFSSIYTLAVNRIQTEKDVRSHLSIDAFEEKLPFNGYDHTTQSNQQIEHIIVEKTKKFIYLVIRQSASEYFVRQLEEKDTQAQLEFLRKKNLFDAAVEIAKNYQQGDNALLMETYQSWGDFLFFKHEYASAIEKYKKTIKYVEPSYVIRKFLDQQRNDELVVYLEELHRTDQANNDHTTLLLNCYTRTNSDGDQKAIEQIKHKLNHFLFTGGFIFEARTAINVLRQTGFHDLALALAKTESTKDLLIKILIEDSNENPLSRFTQALQEIEKLPDAEKYMKKYAKVLITKLPYKTTNLLIRICTNAFKPEEDDKTSRQIPPLDSSIRDNSAYSSYGESFGIKEVAPAETQEEENNVNNRYNQKTPSAKEFISAYADQTFWLMVLLENIVNRIPYNHKLMPPVIYNTLLELYLKYHSPNQSSIALPTLGPNDEDFYQVLFKMFHNNATLEEFDSDIARPITMNYCIYPPNKQIVQMSFQDKIMFLLEQCADSNGNTYYDEEHALVLTQSKGFDFGVLHLYKRLGLYYDILQYHIEKKDSKEIIATCNAYGKDDPNMWIQVLSYFARDGDQTEDIKAILATISEHDYLPPLLVVQILASNNTGKIKLSVVKDFLKQKLKEEQQKTERNMEEIKKYQDETTKLQEEIEELRTSVKIFQVARCSHCLARLDLPAVHFMCMHSYHQRCLSADVEECIKCAAKNKESIKMTKMYEDQESLQVEFNRNLENAKDKDSFDVVAQYFGRGIFKPSIFADLDEDI